MQETQGVNVLLSGELVAGSDYEQVIRAFSQLSKLSLEQAKAVVGSRRVIKKGDDQDVAEAYRNKLRNIGLEVELQHPEPVEQPLSTDASSGAGLSLVPTEDLQAAENISDPRAGEDVKSTGLALEPIEQKKEEQPAQVQHDLSAGSVSRSAQAQGVSTPVSQQDVSSATSVEDDVDDFDDEQTATLKTLAIPLAVAIVGAIVWKLIALGMGYEFSLVAWIIGGAVGYSAIMAGLKGQNAAIICGVLVLLSIAMGKYMAISGLQDEIAEQLNGALTSEDIGLQSIYDEQMQDARLYSTTVYDEESLREFMVERGYSYQFDADSVTVEEVANFKMYEKPTLEALAVDKPGFNEWKETALSQSVQNISTFDLLIESLSLIDILFIFMGVGTAYRLVDAHE